MARMTVKFEADSYPYETLRDFYSWEEELLRGAAKTSIDAEATQRLAGALNDYEQALQRLEGYLNRSIFANDRTIIRSVRECLSRPIAKGWGAIDAFYHSENFASAGSIRKHLAPKEIVDPQIQETLNHILDVYTRITHLLVWRQALALPRWLAVVPKLSYFVKNMDLGKEIKSQMRSITSHASLLTISGKRLILPVAMREYLGHAFREILTNSLYTAQLSSKRMNIAVELTQRGDYGVVTITDSAGGVLPEDFRKMFFVGYSSRDVGNGIGWPIAARIVNRHGGSIEVENAPGEGLAIAVALPLCSESKR